GGNVATYDRKKAAAEISIVRGETQIGCLKIVAANFDAVEAGKVDRVGAGHKIYDAVVTVRRRVGGRMHLAANIDIVTIQRRPSAIAVGLEIHDRLFQDSVRLIWVFTRMGQTNRVANFVG